MKQNAQKYCSIYYLLTLLLRDTTDMVVDTVLMGVVQAVISYGSHTSLSMQLRGGGAVDLGVAEF